MATVTQILDYGIRKARLQATGTERTNLLIDLNDVYQRAVEETGCYIGSISWSLTSGTGQYTFGTSPTTTSDISQLLTLRVTSGGTTVPLVPKAEEWIRERQQGIGSTTGDPRYYATLGMTGILFDPTPGSGVTVAGSYVKEAPTLVESAPGAGEESTPTAFKKPYHYKILGNGATALAFEFLQDQASADRYWAKCDQGIAELGVAVEQYGGLGGAALETLGEIEVQRYRDAY